jgi:hypothetical protein
MCLFTHLLKSTTFYTNFTEFITANKITNTLILPILSWNGFLFSNNLIISTFIYKRFSALCQTETVLVLKAVELSVLYLD